MKTPNDIEAKNPDEADRIKSERAARLKIARDIKAQKLGKKSPRQRGTEKMHEALRWIYKWGWSSHSILEIVVGAKKSGLAARLVKSGLLVSTRTESGGGVRDVPAYLLTLSELGLSEVERISDVLLPYTVDPYRIDQRQLRHDGAVQRATAQALASEKITGYITEKELTLKQASKIGIKEPDAVWLQKNIRIAVEVELSKKWDRDLDFFVQASIKSIAPGSGRFDLLAIISDSPAILRDYKKAFSSGESYGVWEKTEHRHWKKVGEKSVPEWAEERILWKKIDFD